MEVLIDNKLPSIIEEDKLKKAYKYVDEIIKGKLFIKLKHEQIILVDGRIIKFSDLLKLLCTKSNFDYKLTFDTADRQTFAKIVEFCELLDWDVSPEIENKKANELHNWFTLYQKFIKEIFNLSVTLRFEKLVNFIRNKLNSEKLVIKDDLFSKTEIGINKNKMNLQTNSSGKVDKTTIDELKSKNFQDSSPPQFNDKNMCLEIPINLNLIKKNAVKNFSDKNKLAHILKDDELNKLTDAMISDSFWFTVSFFNTINKEKKENHNNKKFSSKEEKLLSNSLKEAVIILKRISENYFKFFIKLCDETATARKDQKDLKDNILEIFYDFLSQCVFYSIFLAFPKSRFMFDNTFRFKIVSMFAYIYNGLIIQNFNLDHWDLDLGTGNIIENQNETRKIKKNNDKEKENSKDDFIFPELLDIQHLIINNFKASERKKQDNVILNTPLYRFYTENDKFETLNMIKPIKLSKKDNYDVDAVDRKIEKNSRLAKNAVKNLNKISEYYNKINEENEKNYIAKRKFNMENNKRLNQEFKDIKAKRFQEYANYCIFISSK